MRYAGGACGAKALHGPKQRPSTGSASARSRSAFVASPRSDDELVADGRSAKRSKSSGEVNGGQAEIQSLRVWSFVLLEP